MAGPRRVLLLTAVALASAMLALPPQAVLGQDSAPASRKVKTQIAPVYPDMAKRMNLHGKVKLQVTIAQDGSVKNIQVLGGHPILAGASQDAVRNWKFEPGPKETTQIIEVNFD